MTAETIGRLLIRGGHVVDPSANIDHVCDIAVVDGRIAEIGTSLSTSAGTQVIDAEGAYVLPGVVDSHVHLTDLSHESTATSTNAYERLAMAGVTTAVEFFDFGRALDQWHTSTTGLTMLGLQGIRSYSGTAARPTLRDAVADSLTAGAIGVKLLGGHFPNTPETSARVIEQAAELGAYCAFHAGTTEHGSNLDGMREAIQLAQGNPLHIAHTNAYLRGATDAVEHENRVATELLWNATRVVSEAHLAELNLCLGAVADGALEDQIVLNCLRQGGFSPDVAGLERAFVAGYAHVLEETAEGPRHVTGEAGRELWRADPANSALNFPVNNRLSALGQACVRVDAAGNQRWDGAGEFIVDAISSDGGSWRNVILRYGLALVRFGALTMRQLVHKACRQPALMYGLTAKGHLMPGADGDIVLVEPNSGSVRSTIAGGRVIYDGQHVRHGGGKILTTSAGLAAIRSRGIHGEEIDLAGSLFRTRVSRAPKPATDQQRGGPVESRATST
ncbi:dihydroorotase-like cyclic amidohydrolase [Tamaricihabitans halophyticus]|uniref:Dihydroorotase-like cyclic amidohydrolase n=1 Tax=Tamaricihabitans halophyticus TaxID=1262583 RepID=A0A4R2QFE8_9PSEU|nr:amidohydrolase family protein [Tamaricihabitans halophyticus]TCP47863.1 dihydroorotase-like cyclic amidohydrolase [Tamaricihabitans halophyticus]